MWCLQVWCFIEFLHLPPIKHRERELLYMTVFPQALIENDKEFHIAGEDPLTEALAEGVRSICNSSDQERCLSKKPDRTKTPGEPHQTLRKTNSAVAAGEARSHRTTGRASPKLFVKPTCCRRWRSQIAPKQRDSLTKTILETNSVAAAEEARSYQNAGRASPKLYAKPILLLPLLNREAHLLPKQISHTDSTLRDRPTLFCKSLLRYW